jgi:hypothetical protein
VDVLLVRPDLDGSSLKVHSSTLACQGASSPHTIDEVGTAVPLRMCGPPEFTDREKPAEVLEILEIRSRPHQSSAILLPNITKRSTSSLEAIPNPPRNCTRIWTMPH